MVFFSTYAKDRIGEGATCGCYIEGRFPAWAITPEIGTGRGDDAESRGVRGDGVGRRREIR